MTRFEPITLSWRGEEYRVEPDEVWGLIKVIESKINFYALGRALDAQQPPELDVAEAYCAALRYAGCRDVDPVAVQTELDGTSRMANAYSLFMIMLEARPDVKKKLQALDSPAKKSAKSSKVSQ